MISQVHSFENPGFHHFFPWFSHGFWEKNPWHTEAEAIPWEIDDLFVVDELTATTEARPPQNSTRSICSVGSGALAAGSEEIGFTPW
jgi:hypothetical protein